MTSSFSLGWTWSSKRERCLFVRVVEIKFYDFCLFTYAPKHLGLLESVLQHGHHSGHFHPFTLRGRVLAVPAFLF